MRVLGVFTAVIIAICTCNRADAAAERAPPRPLKLIFTGPPAAGKSTQCTILQQRYGVLHLSSGNMLRSEIARGTALGRKIKKRIEAGNLVDDELIAKLVGAELRRPESTTHGWVLDGFPRTLNQARILRRMGHEPDCVIHLPTRLDVILARVSERLWDPQTGQTHRMTRRELPSAVDNEDIVAGKLHRRADDEPDIAAMRYHDHMQHIQALQQFYGNKWVQIDGESAVSEVHRSITQTINGRMDA